jgi:hypothetical protein
MWLSQGYLSYVEVYAGKYSDCHFTGKERETRMKRVA